MFLLYPIGHEKEVRRIPYITFGLIGANALIWLLTLRLFFGEPTAFLCQYGLVPADFNWLSLFTSMFLHAGFFHLVGNLWFLYLVGCNMEDLWGRVPFLGFYLAAGIVAAFTHMAMNPSSTIPCIGASGAISGVMGAFMIRNYRIRVTIGWLFIFIPFVRSGTFQARAYIVFGWWFLDQLLMAFLGGGADVAVWAHIGGFAFGLLIALLMRAWSIEERYLAPQIEESVELVEQDPRLLEAIEARSSGNFEYSLDLLEQIVADSPQNIDARLEAAQQQLSLGRAEEALENFDRAIEQLLKCGEEETALNLLSELRLAGMDRKLGPDALFRLAKLHVERNRFEDAVSLFGLIPHLHGSHPLAPLALYRCGSIMHEHLARPDLAAGAYRYLIEHYPDTEWIAAVEDALARLAEPEPSMAQLAGCST
jgi:membrane associated rhomboid family serine protease